MLCFTSAIQQSFSTFRVRFIKTINVDKIKKRVSKLFCTRCRRLWLADGTRHPKTGQTDEWERSVRMARTVAFCILSYLF